MSAIDGVSITSTEVREVSSNLRTCKKNMNTNFNDWTSVIRRLTDAENFDGKARASFVTSYDEIKSTFDSYLNLIESFATTLDATASDWEEQDAERAKAAETINNVN